MSFDKEALKRFVQSKGIESAVIQKAIDSDEVAKPGEEPKALESEEAQEDIVYALDSIEFNSLYMQLG